MHTYIKSFALFETVYAKYARLKRLGLVSATRDNYIAGCWIQEKDRERAKTLVDSANPVSKAVSMSKLITDREKLVRRAKAVVSALKRFKPDLLDEVFEPFAKRMAEMGFDENAIYYTLETEFPH
jgi:hypothetical protein